MGQTTPLSDAELPTEGESDYSTLVATLKSLDQVYVGDDAESVVANAGEGVGLDTSDSQNRALVTPDGDRFPIEVGGRPISEIQADIQNTLSNVSDKQTDIEQSITNVQQQYVKEGDDSSVAPAVEPPNGANANKVKGARALVYSSKTDAENDNLPEGTLVYVVGDGLYVEDGN